MTERRFGKIKRRSVMTKGRFVTLPCSKQTKKVRKQPDLTKTNDHENSNIVIQFKDYSLINFSISSKSALKRLSVS